MQNRIHKKKVQNFTLKLIHDDTATVLFFFFQLNSLDVQFSSQTSLLYLNQVIDVGWITCCQTAEDYQNLFACMCWHVPKESRWLICFYTPSCLYAKVSKDFNVLHSEGNMICSSLQIKKTVISSFAKHQNFTLQKPNLSSI